MPAYHVEKSIDIAASPQQVFQVVSDFRTWTTWSPWLIAEPDAQVTISTDSRSVGSIYAWNGEITGQGELEHKSLDSGKAIHDEIRFVRPFKSVAKVSFLLEPAKSGTRLTWTMDGSMPWFMFWMIPMMKTFIGMDYRRGLTMLKDLIESGSIPSKCTIHGIQPVTAVRMAGVVSSCSVEDVGKSMNDAFAKAKAEFTRLGLPLDGQGVSAYTKFRIREGIFEYISGYEIPQSLELKDTGELTVWNFPGGKAFRVEHTGCYRHLGNPWSAANQIVRFRKLKQLGCATFEIYRTKPGVGPEENAITDIYLPLK